MRLARLVLAAAFAPLAVAWDEDRGERALSDHHEDLAVEEVHRNVDRRIRGFGSRVLNEEFSVVLRMHSVS